LRLGIVLLHAGREFDGRILHALGIRGVLQTGAKVYNIPMRAPPKIETAHYRDPSEKKYK